MFFLLICSFDKILHLSKQVSNCEQQKTVIAYYNEAEGGEEMTSNEMYQLLMWLKKEGYTFEQALDLIKCIAEKKSDD